MERKGNGAKQLGFCHRFFNFVMKNPPLYTRGQVTNGRRSVEESKTSMIDEHKGVEEMDAKWLSVDEEGDLPLIPPIITIPVEATEKASVVMTRVGDKQEDKKKGTSVRIKSGKQEKGQDMMKRRPSMGGSTHDGDDDDKFKDDKELTKKVSLSQPPPQEKNKGEVSEAVRPAKPVAKAVTNIDKEADDWIRVRKESFDQSLAASLN